MKAMVVTPLPDDVIDGMRKVVQELVVNCSLSDHELACVISDVSILVVGDFMPVTELLFRSAPNLSLVVHVGHGCGNIDVAAASANGVVVCHTPKANDHAIAELTIGHILACDREIVKNTEHLRHGEWRRKFFLTSAGLAGRTLGLLGMGHAAPKVIEIARSMNMKVIVYPEYPAPPIEGVTYVDTVFDIAKADVVSVHFTGQGVKLGREFFTTMNPGSIFVNTDDAQYVDYSALVDAIKDKDLKVGLDVYHDQPKPTISHFRPTDLADIICSGTCRTAGDTTEARMRAVHEALHIVTHYATTGEPLHALNIPKPAPATRLSIKHQSAITHIIATCERHAIQPTNITNYQIGDSDFWNCVLSIPSPSPELVRDLAHLKNVTSVNLLQL